jgi:hypothetical protein
MHGSANPMRVLQNLLPSKGMKSGGEVALTQSKAAYGCLTA